ncbi:hypothetical protein BT63DRAFT_104418 [Microthyrium microscopicum]|uniref:BZIP domain-containing protein n=1 Tax=Microthyrium microscopicum TaxID=703497 RepID=A0A6A6TVV4_9PEZI|nr:hypothetical protein BT63DRAFT_104418 [Microthyrium microscopicum]
MPSSKELSHRRGNKTKVITRFDEASDLERMRNNQRRSRERRKEYIAELEAKIQTYEALDNQSFTDHKIQLLSQENDTLRKLLDSIGLGRDFTSAYQDASRMALSMSNITTLTSLSTELKVANCCQAKPSSPSPRPQECEKSISSEEIQEVEPLETYINLGPITSSLENTMNPSHAVNTFSWDTPFDDSDFLGESAISTQPQKFVTKSPAPVVDQPPSNSTACTTSSLKHEDTTLCSVAFSLVTMSNRKGHNIADLELKLRIGYHYEHSTFEGCRVDNKILLAVLTEII